MDELIRLLNIHGHMDAKLLNLTCNSEFEPHGKATETWEVVWRIELPIYQVRFADKTYDLVIQKAINFLKERL
jgi:hypothetical protein